MKYKNIACVFDDSPKAQEAFKYLSNNYNFVTNIADAQILVALGGDGFMLHTMHQYMDLDIGFYGMNCGTIGFLLNSFKEADLLNSINDAKIAYINPLYMKVTKMDGSIKEALAINEVSMLRQSKQAATIKITIDGHVRMQELMADGVLVATPAGSTAYNFSVHGPILPLESNLLAVTPISPFRPRRWRGALLPCDANVLIEVLNAKKRPVTAVADFNEVTNARQVEIYSLKNKKLRLLFDKDHSLEERIISEQFMA